MTGVHGDVQRSRGHSRALVLDAAERLFAAHGYRGTSLEEIGREAGVSRGTPGYFFGTKEQLYEAMLERVLLRARDALGGAVGLAGDAEVTAAEVVSSVVEAFVRLLASEPALVRLLQWETLDGHGRILTEVRAYAGPLVQLLQELSTRDGRATLREDEATDLLLGAAALCWFPSAHAEQLQGLLARRPVSGATVRTATEFILHGLRLDPSAPLS